MSAWASDFRVLRQLLLHRTTGSTHQDRLESFYGKQAGDYDGFRSRLLHGRRPLIEKLEFNEGDVWVDLGCGTGENLTLAGDRACGLSEVHLVDLSPSLLKLAEHRRIANGPVVKTHLADATTFRAIQRPADLVTFSYSLTMIPDWFAAIEAAINLLRPGGQIGVTDFYVSRKHANAPMKQHGGLRRAFWQHWFAADNVFLNGDHLAMLRRNFETLHLSENFGKVPYLPFLRAPYYVFTGRRV
ncbi:S-adenosylmethionine-diacylgycerolhomoserine-N-methyltransferase [Rhodopirellula rubra]|uniref:S-adenosylmethionine-diacylgycerolhomoserine-N-methyltransferase n=1 Tax=Aporhodopirellula rubra TaxID=980271 RepID=A0A7W5H9M1_9BACT|nr:class I SAM-dependent methyltransferase [Aporhodopirellula rubra]MBB3210564.1 S-adenosylmethionine-diacylgycerolhomoserine-N-methyltransferase [Aporhodopirellula rubra]